MMKKFLAIVCALAVMLMLLAGCGGKTDDGKSDGKDNTEYTDSGKISVEFWSTWTGSAAEDIQTMADDFNASQDKYEVSVIYNGGYKDAWTKFTAMPKEDWPELVYMNAEKMPDFLYEDGLCVPMQQFADAESYDMSNIHQALLGHYSDGEGNLIMMPMGNTMTGFFYNAELCKSAGIDPYSLNNFPDFVEACRKIAAATDCDVPLGLIRNPIVYTFLYTAEGINGLDNDNGRSDFPTKSLIDADPLKSATVEYLTAIKTMSAEGLMAPFSGSMQDFIDLFCSEEIAFLFTTCASTTAIYDTIDGAFEFGFLPAPTASANGERISTPAGGGGLFIPDNGKSANQQGAWEFIKFILQDKYTSMFSRATGYLPITKSTVEDADYQAYMKEVFITAQYCLDAQANSDPEASYTPGWPAGMDNSTYIYDAIDAVMADPNADVTAVTEKLQKNLQDQLDLVNMIRE